MSWRVAGLLSCAMLAAVVGLASASIVRAMVDEVNRTRAPADHIAALGWYPGKLATLAALYRQAYPHGRRHLQLAGLMAVGVVGFALAAVCLFLTG
jgi:hypothetical protein